MITKRKKAKTKTRTLSEWGQVEMIETLHERLRDQAKGHQTDARVWQIERARLATEVEGWQNQALYLSSELAQALAIQETQGPEGKRRPSVLGGAAELAGPSRVDTAMQPGGPPQPLSAETAFMGEYEPNQKAKLLGAEIEMTDAEGRCKHNFVRNVWKDNDPKQGLIRVECGACGSVIQQAQTACEPGTHRFACSRCGLLPLLTVCGRHQVPTLGCNICGSYAAPKITQETK